MRPNDKPLLLFFAIFKPFKAILGHVLPLWEQVCLFGPRWPPPHPKVVEGKESAAEKDKAQQAQQVPFYSWRCAHIKKLKKANQL